ncbi:MAG: 30S ribosome-binding factor RbfA [Anaerolineae bacterium]
MPGYRVQKAASFIRDEIIKVLLEQVHDPRVKGVTVTEVTLSPDRRVARVYITNFGSEEEMQTALDGLRSCKGLLRHEISQLLHWNFAPELDFRMDNSWNYGQRIDSLIAQLNETSTQAPEVGEGQASEEPEDEDQDGNEDEGDVDDDDL